MPIYAAPNTVPFTQQVLNKKVTDGWMDGQKDGWMDRWMDSGLSKVKQITSQQSFSESLTQ